MRLTLKLLGGTGVLAAVVVGAILGSSQPVSGDSSEPPSPPTPSSTTASSAAYVQNPNEPYPLGPHTIEYDQLSTADKAAVDAIQEAVDTSQPPSSYQTWSAATAATGEQAAAEISARSVGLVGTAEDGVVP